MKDERDYVVYYSGETVSVTRGSLNKMLDMGMVDERGKFNPHWGDTRSDIAMQWELVKVVAGDGLRHYQRQDMLIEDDD